MYNIMISYIYIYYTYMYIYIYCVYNENIIINNNKHIYIIYIYTVNRHLHEIWRNKRHRLQVTSWQPMPMLSRAAREMHRPSLPGDPQGQTRDRHVTWGDKKVVELPLKPHKISWYIGKMGGISIISNGKSSINDGNHSISSSMDWFKGKS